MCVDGRLKFCFSFTRDSYKGFLLCHSSFSYVIVSQKTYTQDEGSISFGRGNNFYLLSLHKTFFTQHFESIFQPVQSQCSVNQYIGKKVCSILIYFVKVEDFLNCESNVTLPFKSFVIHQCVRHVASLC